MDVVLERVGRLEARDLASVPEKHVAVDQAVGALGVELLRALGRVGREVDSTPEPCRRVQG